MMSSMSSPPPSSPSSSSSSSKGGASDRCTDRRREIASDDGTKESTTIITALPSSSSSIIARRSLLLHRVPAAAVVVSSLLLSCRPPAPAFADFAPGGTLLDREISVTYGNPEASKSRNRDNSNVLFDRDNYYKFGSAAPWIDPPGSTDFPKTVPFVPSQQRYDALKKYGYRIVAARDAVSRIGGATAPDDVPDRTDPTYQLRALGLLANAFLATENTGTTNELMLARWYVNEMYLGIGDYRDALSGGGDEAQARVFYGCLVKATNSYLSLLNRSISSKIGDQFGYIV